MIRHRASFAFGSDAVERDAAGVPVAFRIWRNGDNETDMGVHRFTERSAAELMAAQAMRGNEISIDVDHLSLSKDAPVESRKAVGWMQLAVRPDGLWAVNVRWAPMIAAGLTAEPPEWRYFSPAYNTTKDGEIVQYLNTALTNNPRTWNVTALAALPPTKGNPMTYEEALAALMGDDEEKKKAAQECMRAAFEKSNGDGKGEPPKEAAKTAAEEPPKSEEPPKEEKPKTEEASTVAALASMAKQIADANAKLATIEKEKAEKAEAEARDAIFATRTDLPVALKASLAGVPTSVLATTLKHIPVTRVDARVSAQFHSPGTRGDTQGGDGTEMHRASMLPPEERQTLKEGMGTATNENARPFWAAGGYRTYPQMTRASATQYARERKIRLPAPKPILAPVAFAGSAPALGGGSK